LSLSSRLQQRRRDRRHARLVRQARAGSEPALVRLYDELHGTVADYLEPRAPSPQDAEDLIATVFHRFLQNLARFDPARGSVTAWLVTMARHALIDHLRRERPQADIEPLADILAGPAPDPLAGLIRTEQADRVRALLARQPAETRELFALHYGQGLRLREIAAMLGLTEAAVKQRLARARRDLRQRWQDDDSQTARRAPCPAPVRAGEGEV
jgi:RNA polymerase sigma-70 factor (ECF subfamily)